MSKPKPSHQTRLGSLLTQELSYWWELILTNNHLGRDKIYTYEAQRHHFLLSRLQLEAKICFLVTLTLCAFVLCIQTLKRGELTFWPLFIGGVVELGLFICWALCRTAVGSQYPQLIFLGLCWSMLFTVQIGTAVVGEFDPETKLWMLVFLTQATLVPVLWPLHLLSQLGVLICCFSLYALIHPTLEVPLLDYAERGAYLFWTCLICNFSVFLYERLQKAEFKARLQVEAAQQQSDLLLRNILPEKIVEQLKQHNTIIAESYEEVTVLFADLVGFTEFSAQISPTELVKLLNHIFSMFDQLAVRYEVEKIKTIGDAYMVVAGLPTLRDNHAVALAEMALAMQEAVEKFNREQGYEICLRIGMNTGPVVAGVIGLNKWTYDLWGDTVNTASRMESQGIPGAIQVTDATYERLKDQYLFEERARILIKGKGMMNTYLLKGRRSTASLG